MTFSSARCIYNIYRRFGGKTSTGVFRSPTTGGSWFVRFKRNVYDVTLRE